MQRIFKYGDIQNTSLIPHKNIAAARILSGVHLFFLKKLKTFFSRRLQKTV